MNENQLYDSYMRLCGFKQSQFIRIIVTKKCI